MNSMQPIYSAMDTMSEELDELERVWMENIEKLEQTVIDYETELLADDPKELSVLAQDLVFKLARRSDDTTNKLGQDHKELHHPVSRLGKDIEKHLATDVHHLLRSEKNIEEDSKSQRLVEGILTDYMLTAGYPSEAEILVEEAALGNRLEPLIDKLPALKEVVEALEIKNVFPAIEWLDKNTPDETRLRFDLRKQHAVELIRKGHKQEAMTYAREMSSMGYDKDVSQLMGALVRGVDDPRYKEMFSPLVWPQLASRVSQVMSQAESHLEAVMETGTRATLALMRLKRRIGSKKESLFAGEELPCAVSVPEHVHNTFTCPILRAHSTEANPPMKLRCGHVISKDALTKLSQTNRHFRLKCPYCPDEAPINDAVRVIF